MPRKIQYRVVSLTDHGGRVYTVDLIPVIPLTVFRPGQFLHLTVDDYDPAGFWPESRVCSIASSPLDRHTIRICYSVKGRYTEKMEQLLKVGAGVWIKLPYGEFLIDGTRLNHSGGADTHTGRLAFPLCVHRATRQFGTQLERPYWSGRCRGADARFTQESAVNRAVIHARAHVGNQSQDIKAFSII